MKKIVTLSLTCAIALAAVAAQAATVSFSLSRRFVTAAESGAAVEPAPAGGWVWGLFVTTSADILSIGKVLITHGQLYQNSFGSNNAKPNPALIPAFPSLAADSYIDTPGANTAILGMDMPGDGTENSAWGDLTDDGPQVNFQVAQITFPADAGIEFSCQVTVAGAAGPQNFSFAVANDPEPATFSLASIAFLGLAAFRRRRS